MIFNIFILTLLAEFAIISVALFRLVAVAADLRVAVDEVLGKLSETEVELRQVREDLKLPQAPARRERKTLDV